MSVSYAAIKVFDDARNFLIDLGKKPTIILKQTEHFGDTLYATPVLRHYRLKYADAGIVFVTGDKFAEAHQFNPHINKLCAVQVNQDWRYEYKKKLDSLTSIDIKLTPHVIFAKGWPELTWSLPNLYDQYLKNAGITDLTPIGGRLPVCITSPEDEKWATDFIKTNKIDPRKTIALEYHFYSDKVAWSQQEFQQFCFIATDRGIQIVALAARHEGIYQRCIDGRGTSWRRSAALLNRLRGIVGVGSGMCVLTNTCSNRPFIFEINVPDSISSHTMFHNEKCVSIRPSPSPEHVVNMVQDQLKT